MATTEKRVRLTSDQVDRIHRFALVENRSFDGAARRLINLGLLHAQQAAAQPSHDRRNDE